MVYCNLVKAIKNESGKQVVCAFDDTDKCSKNCYNCVIFKGILLQLHTFEEIADGIE